MKIIISHDVDHLTISEHLFNDLIIPKQIVRKHIELFIGNISFKEYLLRWLELFQGKMQNIYELQTFNNKHQIPSTWFFATARGKGLSYHHRAIDEYVRRLISEGASVELHGICYYDKSVMLEEKKRLESKKQSPVKGVRIHYLKKNHDTLNLISECGYSYDSSLYEFKNPYKICGVWEFPIHIMDGYIIENHNRYQSVKLSQAMDVTIKFIERGLREKIKYFVIDFHDRYFTPKFKTWMDWYTETIFYLKKNGFEFINFEAAIAELEKNVAEN